MTDTVRVPRGLLSEVEGLLWLEGYEGNAQLLNDLLAASPQGEGSSADTHRAAEGVVEALRSITAWLYSWGQHVGSCRGGGVCTCGLTAMREQGAVALDAVNRVTEGVKP